MAIALIIVLLCVMLGVMVYVIASLVKFVVLLGVRHKNEVEIMEMYHDSIQENLKNDFKKQKNDLRTQLTEDFLVKAELMRINKDAKIAIPLTKVDVVQIPVQNDIIGANYFNERPDFVSYETKTMKSEEIRGDYKIEPFVLRNPRLREQLKDAIAKEVAKYLIMHDLIESAVDERNMMICFSMNILR